MTQIGHSIAYSAIALFALTMLGNIVYRVLGRLMDQNGAPNATTTKNGRVIGTLERLLLAAALIIQSWHLVAAVIALKSVARFKELEHKAFAEYFLIGSLFSLFWALLVTTGWLTYDKAYGSDLHGQLRNLLGL